ncbi:MAG: NADH-quinone oxidoreductase subunit L, partial [Melioribacteraceae bacterium]|nr:NADH-quinone oxidoreductase subunit L [Melioribacteraceae bacterium]
MSELGLINLTIIILFLPLIGFGIVLFFGKKFPKIYLLEVGILISAFILSLVVGFFKLNNYIDQNILFSFTWIDFGNVSSIGPLSVELGIKIDNITVLMLFVVNIISMLVHIYSIEYMRGD